MRWEGCEVVVACCKALSQYLPEELRKIPKKTLGWPDSWQRFRPGDVATIEQRFIITTSRHPVRTHGVVNGRLRSQGPTWLMSRNSYLSFQGSHYEIWFYIILHEKASKICKIEIQFTKFSKYEESAKQKLVSWGPSSVTSYQKTIPWSEEHAMLLHHLLPSMYTGKISKVTE